VWDLSALHPIEGWGWIGAWQPTLPPFPSFFIPGEREPTSAVNAYLDVLLQLGIVGVVVFGGLVVLAFTRSWLLAGRQRNLALTWPALVLLTLIVTSLGESSLLGEYGWLTFVVCAVKASQQLSWRNAFARPLEQEPL
jgi:O-antigen ligase